MINIIKGFARGKGAFKGVDKGITNVIEDWVRDVLDLEMFVTMSKGYAYFFSYPKECLLQIARGVW
jgi:hypothetical protein